MAGNSLNTERSNQDKLLQMEKQSAEARKRKIKILIMVAVAVLAVVAYVVCLIFLRQARHWLIAATIGLAYALLWNLLRYKTKFDYVPLYLFTNICLGIACIPLFCVSNTTRAYAFGFSLAILLSAIGLLLQCWQNVSVETKQSRYSYRSERVKVYTFQYNGREYFITFYSTLAGGILFAISLGLLFSGMARALVIGCAIAVIYTVMSFFATILYYDNDMSTVFIVINVVLGLTGLAFLIASYYLTVLAICLFAAVVLSSVAIAIARSEGKWHWGAGSGAFCIGIAVLVLLFGHVPVSDEFVIKNGVLLSYNGTEEVVVIPEEVTKIRQEAFAYKGPRNNMKEVVFHDGITFIGDAAFQNCDALTTVTVPGSVAIIPEGAFFDCDSLTSVTLKDGVTTIKAEAFYSCDALVSVDLPESLTDMWLRAFQRCTSLKEIYLPISLSSMGSSIFWGDNITIYYAGSAEEWESIEVPSGLFPKWSSGAEYKIVYDSKKSS